MDSYNVSSCSDGINMLIVKCLFISLTALASDANQLYTTVWDWYVPYMLTHQKEWNADSVSVQAQWMVFLFWVQPDICRSYVRNLMVPHWTNENDCAPSGMCHMSGGDKGGWRRSNKSGRYDGESLQDHQTAAGTVVQKGQIQRSKEKTNTFSPECHHLTLWGILVSFSGCFAFTCCSLYTSDSQQIRFQQQRAAVFSPEICLHATRLQPNSRQTH